MAVLSCGNSLVIMLAVGIESASFATPHILSRARSGLEAADYPSSAFRVASRFPAEDG